MDELVELGKKLNELRNEKDELESKLKEINKAKSWIEDVKLPEKMQLSGVPKFVIEGVGTVYLKGSCHAHIRAEDQDKAYKWLGDNGHRDLIKETIHWGTLRKFVNELSENAQPIPDFFNANFFDKAVLRRSNDG